MTLITPMKAREQMRFWARMWKQLRRTDIPAAKLGCMVERAKAWRDGRAG